MSEPINDGGSAFPNTAGWRRDPDISDGMSLRDYFAAKAMQSLVALDCMAATMVAEDAYAIADAMLAARDKK